MTAETTPTHTTERVRLNDAFRLGTRFVLDTGGWTTVDPHKLLYPAINAIAWTILDHSMDTTDQEVTQEAYRVALATATDVMRTWTRDHLDGRSRDEALDEAFEEHAMNHSGDIAECRDCAANPVMVAHMTLGSDGDEAYERGRKQARARVLARGPVPADVRGPSGDVRLLVPQLSGRQGGER